MESQIISDLLPAKTHTTFVFFAWGDAPHESRYANWPRPVWIANKRFEPLPAMTVRYGRQHGGSRDVPVEVELPANTNPTAALLTGYPHANVQVIIGEAIPEDQSTYRDLWFGIVRRAFRNYQGRAGVAMLEVWGIKSMINVRLGIICNPTCSWTFGDKNCRIPVVSLIETGTVTAVNGNDIDVDGVSGDAGYFTRGVAEVDKLRIPVRKHNGGPRMTLALPAPPAWVGETIAMTPGCNKTIAGCRAWANESRFGGLGYNMPSYNPLFESDR